MIVEALYRDGRRERLVVGEDVTLVTVVALAQQVYGRSPIKHLKILPPKEKPRDPA